MRDQVVTPFVDTTARSSAIAAPVAGMVSVLTGTNATEFYTGTVWHPITPGRYADTTARATAVPTPIDGSLSVLTTTDRVDVYNGTSWSALVAPSNGAWTSYVPTWSGTIGNGTLTGAYQRVGRTVHYKVNILWGTTTSHPASTQTLTVPFTGVTINGYGYTNAAGSIAGVVVQTASATTTFQMRHGAGATLISNLAPGTYTNLSTLDVTGTYEASADA